MNHAKPASGTMTPPHSLKATQNSCFVSPGTHTHSEVTVTSTRGCLALGRSRWWWRLPAGRSQGCSCTEWSSPPGVLGRTGSWWSAPRGPGLNSTWLKERGHLGWKYADRHGEPRGSTQSSTARYWDRWSTWCKSQPKQTHAVAIQAILITPKVSWELEALLSCMFKKWYLLN